MKKLLLGLSLVGALLLGGCQEEVEFNAEGLKEYDSLYVFELPQGVKNGTVTDNISSAIVFTNIHHNNYLNAISELNIKSGNLKEDDIKEVVRLSSNFRDKILDTSMLPFTDVDEELAVKVYDYIFVLNRKADNISRFVQHGDSLNLKQAEEFHKESMKIAKEIDKLAEKNGLNYGAK